MGGTGLSFVVDFSGMELLPSAKRSGMIGSEGRLFYETRISLRLPRWTYGRRQLPPQSVRLECWPFLAYLVDSQDVVGNYYR